jgi:hypothetical protein
VIEGTFDGFSGMTARGWAWQPGDAVKRVVVQLLIDSHVHDERVASEFRAD